MIRMTIGALLLLSASGPAAAQQPPAQLFDQLLPDAPDQRLTVHRLTLGDIDIPPHRHTGSVYLYVLEGAAVLAVDGQPERIVRAGESFFEPAGALHSVARSAETGRPAVVLAVTIGPDRVPPATFELRQGDSR